MARFAAQAGAAVASQWIPSAAWGTAPPVVGIAPDWQPLDVVTGDALFTAARVNGSAAQGILDSGSGATIIDARLAATLGLRGEARTVAGLATKTEVILVKRVTITLGDTPRDLPFALVGDLRAMASALGRPIDLLLGADLFADRCLTIDIPRRRMAFSASGSFAGGRGWTALPLARGDRRELLTSVAIAGTAPVPMMIDTGSSSALLLSANYLRSSGIARDRRSSSALMAGVDGIQTVALMTIDAVDFGGLRIDAVPAVGMPRWASTSAAGTIGMPLLAQFDLVFDLARNTLWLRPLARSKRLPMLKDRSGLGTRLTPSGLEVVHVARGGPGERGGWAVGERITAIDGKPVDERYTRGELWRWRYAAAGRVVALTLGPGKTRSLRLEDFF